MGVVRLCKVSASYLILAAIACVIFCSLLPVIFTVTVSRSLLLPSIYDYHVFCAVYMLPSGGQSTQIKYLSKSTDTYNKILLQ